MINLGNEWDVLCGSTPKLSGMFSKCSEVGPNRMSHSLFSAQYLLTQSTNDKPRNTMVRMRTGASDRFQDLI